jgi:hypothetical protein
MQTVFCSRALTNCGFEYAVSEMRTVPTQQSKYLLCCVQRRASAQNPKQTHVRLAEWRLWSDHCWRKAAFHRKRDLVVDNE